MESMKAYRSLEAYNFFISGWIHTCFYKKSTTGHCIIAGKVNRSQAVTDTPHKAWIGIDTKNNNIDCAHCSCMAGLGEVCSHVAAILFKVECNTRLGHNEVACTSVPCEWTQTFVKKVEGVPLDEIDFNKPKKQRVDYPTGHRRQHVNNLDTCDATDLLRDLKKSAPNAVVFSVVEPKQQDPLESRLPQVLSNLYVEDNTLLSADELHLLCERVSKTLSASKRQCENLEKSTRSQSKSGIWKKYRNGRITASNFHEVVHTNIDHPSQSLIVKVCNGTNFSSAATSWGMENESCALSAYMDKMKDHTNVRISKCGLFMNPNYPFLGATPDSIVECDCCGKGTVEVKCPFKHRDMHPCGVSDKLYCLNSHEQCDSGMCDNTVKFGHKYFHQIQGQMGICQLDYCDFVCFTNKGIHIERVLYDDSFFKNLVAKLRLFHQKWIMPELLAKTMKLKPV